MIGAPASLASPTTGTSINDPLMAPMLSTGDRGVGSASGHGAGMRGGGIAGLAVLDPHSVTFAFGLILLVLVLLHLRVHAAVGLTARR